MAFLLSLVAAAALTASFAGPAQRAPGDRIYVEFENSVRVPGALLPPGAYIFIPGSAVAGQLIIEIYTGDGSRLVATVLAIESAMPRPSHATLVDFPDTRPAALRAWFHPAHPRGYEFVYSRPEAEALYAESNTPVPASGADEALRSLVGVIPIAHADDLYRAGVPVDISRELGIAAVPPGPIDRLTLARVAILSHLDGLPDDVDARLRLLDSQVRDIYTAYRMGSAAFPWRLSLAMATLDNMPASFYAIPEVAHIIERVRTQLDAFVAYFKQGV